MKIKKTKILFLLFIILVLCNMGCKNQRETPEQQKERESAEPDRQTSMFTASDELKVEETYYLNDFSRWEHYIDSDNMEEAAEIQTDGNGRYTWFLGVKCNENREYDTGENALYLLDVYSHDNDSAVSGDNAGNTDSGNCGGNVKSIKFTPKDIGVSGAIGYIVSADVLADDSYMFRWAEYELEDEMYCQKSDKIIFTDLKGNNSVNEFYSIFVELGLEEYGKTILPCLPYASCHAVSTDKLWVLNQYRNEQLYIFSQQGDVILERDVQGKQMFYEPIVTDEAQLILPIYDEGTEKMQFFYAGLSDGDWKKAGEMNAAPSDINQFYAMVDNDIYYQVNSSNMISGNGLVRWNIDTGERTWILKYDVNGLAQYDTSVIFVENKPVCVFLGKSDGYGYKHYMVSVSEQKLQSDKDIIVADLVGSCNQGEKAAIIASMDSPDCQYKYVDASSQEEKDRIMAELSNKKGPQIMYVSMDDYYNLIEKGMLCDWYSFMDRSLFADILPGVLELGTVGNSLYGLPVGIRVESMAVGRQLEDSEWTIDTIVELMSEGELNTSLRSPYIFNNKDYLEPDFVINSLTKCAFNNSFIIDWDTKTAHFDDERFIKLLELTREDVSDIPAGDAYDNDIIWAYLNDYPIVMNYLSKADTDYIIMGFPNHAKSGNYIMPAGNGMLVINANITNPEKVVLYIRKLMDKQVQLDIMNFCIGIQKMNVQDFVRTDDSGNKIYMNLYNTREYNEEKILSLFNKAAEFLEGCEPEPQQYGVINRIILEELASMRNNNKSTQDTAKIINDRVEIYLQE
jgi:hypothetical protein